jgi:hypothetical protein
LRRADLLGAALAAAPLLALALLGVPGPVAVTLDLGPNDAAYLAGFAEHHEIEGDTATRWSGREALADLPYEVGGPVTLSWRGARILPESAQVDVRLDGRSVAGYSCRGGRVETRSSEPASIGPTPVRVGFLVDGNDARGLGLRLDWIRVAVGPGGVLRARGAARWTPLALVLGVLLLLRLSGFAPAAAALQAGLISLAAAGWGLHDPHALAHVALRIAPATLAVGFAGWWLVRARPGARWAVACVLLSHLLKGAALFHPGFFYADVQNHRRYVAELAGAEGSIAERGVLAQKAVNTAYPRYVAGKPYAFPYSPLFFVPFERLLPLGPQAVEDAMRHVSLAAAALVVALVFLLAQAVYGEGSGALAALFAALLPPLHSRLLYAMWPTVAGHLLDLAALLAAVRLSLAPSGPALARFGAFQLAAFLTYISSMFNLALLAGWLALLERRLLARLLAVTLATSLATIAFLYADFVRVFFGEILPVLVRGGGAAGPATDVAAGASAAAPAAGSLASSLLAAVSRIPNFYGWGFPAFAIAGLLLARGRPAFRVLLAYALAIATLFAMRGLLPGLFKDLKETTFASAFVAVTAGAAVEALWRRSRPAAALAAAGLAGFALLKCWSYFAAQVSPAMLPKP